MIRTLREFEFLPVWVDLVFQRVDPDWVWVWEEENKIVAIFVTARIHDMVLLCRVQAKNPKNKMWWKKGMKKIAEDCLERGFEKYICLLDSKDLAYRGLNAFFKRHDSSEAVDLKCSLGNWSTIVKQGVLNA